MAQKKENNICSNCKKDIGHTFACEKEGEKTYGYRICKHCGHKDSLRVRMYFGFGEKGGRKHIDHEDLGKVELLQLE